MNSKTYIIVPTGQHFTQYHGPSFNTFDAARTEADKRCDEYGRNVHYNIFAIEQVGTTKTMDEALAETGI